MNPSNCICLFLFFPTTCDGGVRFPPPPLLLFLLLSSLPSSSSASSSAPPAAPFRLGPLPDLYFYSSLLLPSSAPPAALFRLGPLPDLYFCSSSITFFIRWGPLEVNTFSNVIFENVVKLLVLATLILTCIIVCVRTKVHAPLVYCRTILDSF